MKKIRLIARLDVKGPNVIKGVHLEGLRVLGEPSLFANKYYNEGIDEILYMDLVATLYGRSKLTEIVKAAAEKVFVPMTVGGGVRSLEDIQDLLNAGADKVAINTAAVKTPELITAAANKFGSQCVVLSVEAKFQTPGCWEIYTDCGRERTGKDAIKWIKHAESLGVGEVLLTSIDQEGTYKGCDTNLMIAANKSSAIPLIASGGIGSAEDVVNVASCGADAVAIAGALHYQKTSVAELKEGCKRSNLLVRSI